MLSRSLSTSWLTSSLENQGSSLAGKMLFVVTIQSVGESQLEITPDSIETPVPIGQCKTKELETCEAIFFQLTINF